MELVKWKRKIVLEKCVTKDDLALPNLKVHHYMIKNFYDLVM